MSAVTLMYQDATIVVTQLTAKEFRARVDFVDPGKTPLVIYTDTYQKAVQKAKELIDDLEVK